MLSCVRPIKAEAILAPVRIADERETDDGQTAVPLATPSTRRKGPSGTRPLRCPTPHSSTETPSHVGSSDERLRRTSNVAFPTN